MVADRRLTATAGRGRNSVKSVLHCDHARRRCTVASRKKIKRRDFLRGIGCGAAVAALGSTVARPGRAYARLGANEKIILGVIGTGGMGTRHLEALSVNPNCAVAVVCDCFKPRYENAVGVVKKLSGKATDGYQDFRKVLDRKDIDAIFVPTPDHWHPLITILGCQAGKDVYVEKPACPTVAEGRAMIRAARRYGRIVQLGTQQRSMTIFQEAMKIVHSGKLGQITSATAWIGENGWGVSEMPGPVPEGLDWDMWLGPAPWEPYSPQRQYGFMGCYDYARGGQLTNWGVHLMDVVHWGIQRDKPLSVQTVGGSYLGGTGSDNYNTVEAIFEYDGATVTWEQRYSQNYLGHSYGIKFQGTQGQLLVDRNTFEVLPESLGIRQYVGEPERSWAHPPHHNNFFECVKTRNRPAAEIEQGVRSTIPVLLAGIALKLKRKLNWDADAERFIRDEQADRYLSRPYRYPWHL
jgi:predicted dehydrogenase